MYVCDFLFFIFLMCVCVSINADDAVEMTHSGDRPVKKTLLSSLISLLYEHTHRRTNMQNNHH